MRSLQLLLALFLFNQTKNLWAQDQDSCYVVYNQTFSETRITDGQPKSTRLSAKYLTLAEYDGTTSRAFRTWELRGKKSYTLIDDEDVVFSCSVLTQGTRKIHVSYWNSFPGGRHFSWSTGQLKSYILSGRTFLLPTPVLTKGVGVPKDSDLNLKEYGVTGVLDLPATQAVNNANPATDEKAEEALISHFQGKGFRFN